MIAVPAPGEFHEATVRADAGSGGHAGGVAAFPQPIAFAHHPAQTQPEDRLMSNPTHLTPRLAVRPYRAVHRAPAGPRVGLDRLRVVPVGALRQHPAGVVHARAKPPDRGRVALPRGQPAVHPGLADLRSSSPSSRPRPMPATAAAAAAVRQLYFISVSEDFEAAIQIERAERRRHPTSTRPAGRRGLPERALRRLGRRRPTRAQALIEEGDTSNGFGDRLDPQHGAHGDHAVPARRRGRLRRPQTQ